MDKFDDAQATKQEDALGVRSVKDWDELSIETSTQSDDQRGSQSPSKNTVIFRLGRGMNIELSALAVNISLTLLNTVAQVGMGISLPMYTDSLQKHKVCYTDHLVGDEYFALLYTAFWFVIFFGALITIAKLLNPNFPLKSPVSFINRCIVGLLNTLNGILVVYASPPDRTPAFLQPLLATGIIPFTVIARYIILRKTVSRPRLICCLAVFVGLIISAEPLIFNIDGGNEGASTEKSSPTKKGIWSTIFIIGFLPAAIANVVEELALQKVAEKKKREEDASGEKATLLHSTSPKEKHDVNTLVFMFWIQLWTFTFLGITFFTDFIPKFGKAESTSSFKNMMDDGFRCMLGYGPVPNCSTDGVVTIAPSEATRPGEYYNPDPHCAIPIGRCWLFIVFYCLANLFSLMLIKYADGAIYLVIVNALVNPLSMIFWSLFALRGYDSKFMWKPTFNTASIYIIIGLLVMVPGVVLYNYLGRIEKKESKPKVVDEPPANGEDIRETFVN